MPVSLEVRNGSIVSFEAENGCFCRSLENIPSHARKIKPLIKKMNTFFGENPRDSAEKKRQPTETCLKKVLPDVY